MDMNGKLENTVRKIIPAGNIILAYSDWTFKASGPDGTPINLGGTAIDVLRKQPENLAYCDRQSLGNKELGIISLFFN